MDKPLFTSCGTGCQVGAATRYAAKLEAENERLKKYPQVDIARLEEDLLETWPPAGTNFEAPGLQKFLELTKKYLIIEDKYYVSAPDKVKELEAKLAEYQAWEAREAQELDLERAENESLKKKVREQAEALTHANWKLDNHDNLIKFKELEAKLAEVKKNYNDLLYQVATKHPNETRHETAKRYIQQAENRRDFLPSQAALEGEER